MASISAFLENKMKKKKTMKMNNVITKTGKAKNIKLKSNALPLIKPNKTKVISNVTRPSICFYLLKLIPSS
jgi:hypothetical protein